MKFLGGWGERLDAVPVVPPPQIPVPVVPVNVPALAGRVHVARTAEEADRIVQLLRASDVSVIALDSEFGFSAPSVPLRSGKDWFDIRSQRPVCFSFAALVADGGCSHVVCGVFDVREDGVPAALAEMLRLRVPFVFHHVKSELFSLWSLGLGSDLPNIADTHLAAASLHLGRHHRRAAKRADPAEGVAAEMRADEQHQHLLSLAGQCAHYGLAHPFAGAKDDLRKCFMQLGDSALDADLVDYAIADAEFTLRLHLAQQPDILRAGLHSHLYTVEFPFAVANARIEWNGVAVSGERLEQLRLGATRAAAHYAGVLTSLGVDPPGSRAKFLRLMGQLGLRDLCRRGGRETVEDDVLEAIEHHHPAIRAFRLHQRYRRLVGEEWLRGAIMGADGRLHPAHGQLGAATGRNTCRTPNLAGIGKVFRPVVVAPPGRALIELDCAQIEVGVAAAEHGDEALIAAYNSGDVYAAMAQQFYAHQVPAEHVRLSAAEFKSRHPGLRDRMKTFVLAVLYNIQPPAIATKFDITETEAANERDRFLSLYPSLKRRLVESSDFGAVRGYATMVSGLRRLRPAAGRPDTWTKNFLRNTPIQGSAAVVFKHALVMLDREFRGSSVQLVLPVHDSILIECGAEEVDSVAVLAAMLMRHALRAYYPVLQPKIDINRADTACWNKDGRSDSLQRFLGDPDIAIVDCGPASGGVQQA